MKRYPKLVQCDGRGQIVIPKEIRRDLGIDEGSGFWMYSILEEGILLKKLDAPELAQESKLLGEIKEKSVKIKVSKKNVEKSEKEYKKTRKGGLDIV
ncbi:AbrB/MazE/SpoVT family DNA-binding domain-containing protein [Candidatus Woesearchaeota archaeon]|nr:AbrB/MazE/SpoVT family DNA-binding domain-containing protein [Candidatus Woesearchaeota archaeon]